MTASRRRNLHFELKVSSAHTIPQGNVPPGDETTKTVGQCSVTVQCFHRIDFL